MALSLDYPQPHRGCDLVARLIERLKKILLSINLFSRLVIQLPLRRYQIEPAQAVIASILRQQGLEFLWVFPRQSGKDEAIAQLCTFLLTLFQRVEAAIIHLYPTANQIATGTGRLENRLDNLWTRGRWWTKSKPLRRGLGSAQIAFFSGHPQARAEGATANLLLIINEAQDQHEPTVERRFTPMRASTNATALYVGTVRTTADYLWRTKERLEQLQQADGQRRVFLVGAAEVGQENPAYRQFVAEQVAKRGREHPIIKTEYFNEPVDVAAGLFPRRRRQLMAGRHPRLAEPQAGQIYLALIDVAGQDEAATEAFAELDNPARDSTCCTIVRAEPGSDIGPTYAAVDLLIDQGSRHFQAGPGRASLFDQLLAYLRHWRVGAVVCDMSGVGQGITDALIEALTRPVFGFDFAKSYGKSRLGNDFLAIVETGRFKYFADQREVEGSDAWWFDIQAEHCGYELAEGIPIERGLRWGVSPAAKISVNEVSEYIHDDRLLSAALVAEADRLIREGKLFLTTGQSAVIKQPQDTTDPWS